MNVNIFWKRESNPEISCRWLGDFLWLLSIFDKILIFESLHSWIERNVSFKHEHLLFPSLIEYIFFFPGQSVKTWNLVLFREPLKIIWGYQCRLSQASAMQNDDVVNRRPSFIPFHCFCEVRSLWKKSTKSNKKQENIQILFKLKPEYWGH